MVASVQEQTKNSQHEFAIPDTGSLFLSYLNIPGFESLDTLPAWSYYPSRRDRALRNFWKSEPMVSGAVYSIQARLRALDHQVISMSDWKQKYYTNLLDRCNFGKGFANLVGKTVVDLCTQDNGAFWELMGAGDINGPMVGPVQDIAHIDSACCWRTFSQEFPVIYVNPVTGRYHRLHKTRVVTMSSMPQPDELARDIGFCAVSRALRVVQIMKAIQIYKYEKITGSRPGIGFGNGLTQKMFRAATEAAERDDIASGATMWKNVPFILNPDSGAKVNLSVLSLAGLPDGFDAVDDTTLYMYALALAFGVDAREFWPATSSGATKADATIQHMKARGKGLGDLIKTIDGALQRGVLPHDGSVKSVYDLVDTEEDQIIANHNKVVVDTLTSVLKSGAINKEQFQKLLLSKGILDPRIVKEGEGITDGGSETGSDPTEEESTLGLEEVRVDNAEGAG